MSPRHVTIVASELLGRAGTGGAGTADSLLAIALGRHGHRVRLLAATGREVRDVDAVWTERYASSGVEIRIVERLEGITPDYMRPSFEVFEALREQPPEVVVVDDWRGLGCLAQRARQVDLALRETAFVVHCHGPARVLAEFARKVPDTLARFGEEVMERASLELADAVVSPSRWLLDWMRTHGWLLPDVPRVIPYLLQSTVLGDEPPRAASGVPVRRLAFFGQLREGKGIRIYLEALNALDPSLLEGIDLIFLGRESKRWTADTIASSLSPRARGAASAVRLETSLDRTAALVELRRPGTLALMPSLLDNSPNTVSECIENGVPFLSTRTGGIPELLVDDDRERILCDPTAGSLASALQRALEAPDGVAPARPAHDATKSLRSWLELVASAAPPPRARAQAAIEVDVVALGSRSEERACAHAARASRAKVHVVRAGSRRTGIDGSSSEWIVFLDEEVEPGDELLDALVTGQQASGADVVTCAVRDGDSPHAVRLFLGNPGPLGLAENLYGVVGLVRRALVASERPPDGAIDPDWVLLSRCALAGARIVSIPKPLALHRGRPGKLGDVPGDGLTVLEAFEEAGSEPQPELPQLAATLAAALSRAEASSRSAEPAQPFAHRTFRALRREGLDGVAQRARERLRTRLGRRQAP